MSEDRRPSPAVRRGLRIGQLFGVPVYVSGTWLFVAVLIVIIYGPLVSSRLPELSTVAAYTTAAGFVVLLFASVLLHELGHAITAKQMGIKVRAMTLWMLGGYTEMEGEPRSPGAEFLVAVAGPLVNAVLGGAGLIGLFVLESDGVIYELALQLTISNLTVAVFNMLPGLPLDGGGMVRALIWRLSGNRHAATVAAGWSGRVVAVLVIAGGVALATRGRTSPTLSGLLFTFAIGVFLWMGASQSIRMGKLTARLPALDARTLVRPFLSVPPEMPLSEALRKAQEAQVRGLVVVDATGTATGVVSEHAVTAVPDDRRPWTQVSTVSRTLVPGLIIPAQAHGEELLRLLQGSPATEYLVADDQRIIGVLSVADVAETLENPPQKQEMPT